MQIIFFSAKMWNSFAKSQINKSNAIGWWQGYKPLPVPLIPPLTDEYMR